ncbi:LysR family transcriptional regulator [Luteimonas huabeiensis]|uniref:LysR family transcriptional regulator n=1 Tax=Luteimonas huabeiensis TaxID=1244513 RepID=UPI0004650EB4|nr:LysR family transcriptional regulator [Luteimonas huabeiensis]
MDLRQLRAFIAVAKARNFTRAAQALHMAQPPLSRQIQQLEEELGVLLLQRTRPLRLTDAGRLFYEEALQILGRVEQMKEGTRRVGRSERRVVTLGFVASTLYGGLPTVVRRLRQRRTDLDVRLLEIMSVQQVEALKTGRIDVGFGRIRSSDDGIVRQVLREERLVVAIPPSHPLASRHEALPVSGLAEQRLIIYPSTPRPSFADEVLSLLRDHALHVESLQEVRELHTALGLVAAESGICVLPASARSMRRDLHYRLIDDERVTSPIILSHRRNDDSGLADQIRAICQEMYAESPPWMEAPPHTPPAV